MFKKALLCMVLNLTVGLASAETIIEGVKVYSIEDYITYILGLAFIAVGAAIIWAILRE
jgi:hypothetical protein